MFDQSMENSSSCCVTSYETIMMINDTIDGMLPTDENFKSFPLFYLSIHFHAENQFESVFIFHLSIHFQFYGFMRKANLNPFSLFIYPYIFSFK